MRIGIDGTVLMGKPAGLGYYAGSIISRLIADKNHEWVVFSPGPVNGGLTEGWSVDLRVGRAGNKIVSALWQQSVLPFMIMKEKLDVFWSPHHYLPLLTPKVPMVCTIHDMVYTRYPQDMPTLRFIAEKTLLPPSVKKAAAVITDSFATEKDLYDYVPSAKGKTHVIHLGPVPLPESANLSLRDMGIHSPYVLFIGSRQRRKNLRRLIEAFLKLPDGIRQQYQLVITGKNAYGEDFHDIAGAAGFAGGLVFTGYLERDALSRVLAEAKVFAIVSLIEGFGLTLLEAMASEVPILASNASSLPEVAGDAAFYVDPMDTGSISEGLQKLLTDKGLRQDLVDKGKKRLNQFSWETAAQKTMEVFMRVAKR